MDLRGVAQPDSSFVLKTVLRVQHLGAGEIIERARQITRCSILLGDELQALSERAVLVHEQILDTRAEQMNKTMLLLTAVTVILMPLTVISGVLGMNVAGIPYADSPHAFWVVGGILAVIGAMLFLIMRRVKWL